MQRHQLTPSASRIDATSPDFLRMPTVMRMTGLGRSTIYRLMADQKFPSPVRLGSAFAGWPGAGPTSIVGAKPDPSSHTACRFGDDDRSPSFEAAAAVVVPAIKIEPATTA